LTEELVALPDALRERLDARGFDPERLARWATDIGNADERNRIKGAVTPVPADRIAQSYERGSDDHKRMQELGSDALSSGKLAVCVLAGGMATRMGGVVKALVEIAPGHTFLDVRLAERAHAARTYGSAPPLWLMTSEATNGPIIAALGDRRDGVELATFEQLVSLRLTEAGTLFVDQHGEHSVYATGHGDLPEALQRSRVLERFVDRGGKYVLLCNLDNLGARVDAAILGHHIASGAALTVELVDKDEGDQGGGPVMHDGVPIICEHFRLPKGFDADSVAVFNTNTFWIDAQKLLSLQMDWTYVEVRKAIADKSGDERVAIQFERLLGEITVGVTPRFLAVPRDGIDSRFIPVKSQADLDDAQPVLAAMARSLGLR
jgi:UTP--glucose-1-phosphate uridylyltransferase